MRPTMLRWLGLNVLLTVACGDAAATDDLLTASALSAGQGNVGAQAAAPGGDEDRVRELAAQAPIIDERGVPSTPDTECPGGASTGPIRVEFRCDEVTVHTCKDLSNVVLQLEDGVDRKVEGLSGHTNKFASHDGQAILRVWVKSGSNHSGEGPGYGERFEAPSDSCTPGDDSVQPDEHAEPPAPDADAEPAEPEVMVVI